MEYTVKALAELAGVTPRTLRWYDQKGLLKPRRTTEAGYRIYGPGEVDRLQAILFYKELGLELEAVREILDAPGFDRVAALEARRRRLDALILTVEKTIEEAKGGTQMSDKEKFEAFKRQAVEANEEQYGREIREQYGPEAVEASNARLLSMTEEEHGQWKALEAEILSALAAAVRAGEDPAGPEGRRIAELHRRWLCRAWDKYTPQAHRGVAELYTADQRFTAYYDQEVPGCAAFLRDAVQAYTE
ncbi:MerR family transcriptional regulator [uncultured Oscillibacter sp.]|uniref:MerR family transcriptional regulator n=1 Tax=uncultured Oscillibacter sp. TaxID=876091 RepID=UPI002638A713|nr:MerR family transcriptional regulator [uncultured Oscillibacter sp.]